jgi:ComF family protein
LIQRKSGNYFYNFISLIFPRLCAACGNNLAGTEQSLCTKCLYELPTTNFHDDPENEVAKLFWGRVKIEKATSFYYYFKGSKFQKPIHQLKYRGQKHIGVDLGRIFGLHLKETGFSNVDLIIPVPLHFRKLKKRGYNQSELIAIGMAETLEKPVAANILFRAVYNPTQTKKSRYERWANVDGIFLCKNENLLENKHVLLVDDVITTGSTLEACAHAISGIENTRVSVATLAIAKY